MLKKLSVAFIGKFRLDQLAWNIHYFRRAYIMFIDSLQMIEDQDLVFLSQCLKFFF